MRQDQLDGLVTFVAVEELSSFSAAAVRLGISPSAVSQSVRTLKHRLGVTLFNRTTRSVSLTEMGSQYLERLSPLLRDIIATSEDIGHDGGEPSGLLRLNVPRAGYMTVLQPILGEFMNANPKVKLEVTIEGRLVDIVAEGFDAGIRFGDLVEKDMIAVKIGPPISAHMVASPAYIARQGIPSHPRDLLNHDCICLRHMTTGQIERWEFFRDGESFELSVPGRLTLNDSAALVQAALDGLGIVYMINGYIDRFLGDGRLVRILEDWSPPLAGLTLYYPDPKRVPMKLRALIDLLRRPSRVALDLDGMVG